MPKPSRQTIIDAIIKEIEQGTTRGRIVSKFVKKCQVTERTIDRYWKTANEQHTVKQAAIKKELMQVDTAAAIAARKKAIMTSDERKEFLTALIKKQLKVMEVGSSTQMVHEYVDATGKMQKEIINYDNKLKAIAELNKMEGDYAKQEIDLRGETIIRVIRDKDL